MGFVRFVIAGRHPHSGVQEGIFRQAYTLRDDPRLPDVDRQSLRDNLSWFEKYLPLPERFTRSKSKGFYRRNTRGISWLRDDATECLRRMHEIKRVLEADGHPVTMICEDRIGYIVYEDDIQVVAEPFSDTSTGP